MQVLEKERKKSATFVICGIFGFVIGILMVIFANLSDSPIIVLMIFGAIIFVASIVFVVIGNIKFRKISREFKANYLTEMIKTSYPGCAYEMNRGITQSFAGQTRIVPMGDRFRSEDLISGQVGDVNFLTCDCHSEEMHIYTDSKGNTHTEWVTIFLGRFFEFDFNKDFKGTTIGTESKLYINLSGLQKRELESEAFNKKFKVYTDDDETAFYIITPQIEERFMKLEETYKGRCSFCFTQNHFFFTINNNVDTFELRLFKKIDNNLVDSYMKDIELMKTVIEELKLNLKIYKNNIE